MVFPVVMYESESWTIKKAKHRRIDAFELWCWKSLLLKVKEESEKAGLKLNTQKMKIMASSLITSQQTDGKTMDTVTDFIHSFIYYLQNHCSHEFKRSLLLGRKAMTNSDSILKSRDIILPTKLWFFPQSSMDRRVGL